MEAKLTIICTKNTKMQIKLFRFIHTHFVTFIFKVLNLVYFARVQQLRLHFQISFKSRIILFSVSENTYRAVNLRRRAHVYNSTRPGQFQIINASQLKAKRKTRRKKVGAHLRYRNSIINNAHLKILKQNYKQYIDDFVVKRN
ncbi:Hypothetical_protein [Hexamita inflata]|uniref:Hypothetical_protein n=1 Tax=Hexamita inflata TaxID=28002 RepID=A0AA86RHJ6_9EUKA|nr:Hypothetical protein HINF_LOCUS60412 [Hexamita inflata]